MILRLPIQPISLNYNIISVFMLISFSFQIVTGIFLVCFIAPMRFSFFKCGTLMRDVLMDGLFAISRKRSLVLFHRSICPFISRTFLWFLFLSADYYGVRCSNIIINDNNFFLGYVLHGVKCHIGQLRNN